MYRKGLSSRANKVSSLVASTDNSGPGSIGQDAVPTAGAHGVRKNVFRRMPSLIPKKSKSQFAQQKKTKQTFQNRTVKLPVIIYFGKFKIYTRKLVVFLKYTF